MGKGPTVWQTQDKMVVYIFIYEYMYTCIYINICIEKKIDGKKNRYLHIFTLRMGPRVWEDLGCDGG